MKRWKGKTGRESRQRESKSEGGVCGLGGLYDRGRDGRAMKWQVKLEVKKGGFVLSHHRS